MDKSLEEQIDENIDEINIGVVNLKNSALEMNFALDRDKELLDKINNKSEIVTTNMKKIKIKYLDNLNEFDLDLLNYIGLVANKQINKN